MIETSAYAPQRSVRSSVLIGFGLIAVVLLINAGFTYRNARHIAEADRLVAHSHEVINALQDILKTTLDAETGSRGYLITGEPAFLEPYNTALATLQNEVDRFKKLTAENPRQQTRLAALAPMLAARLDTLQRNLDVRKTQGFETARQRVLTGVGKQQMDAIRAQITGMERAETALLQVRADESRRSFYVSLTTLIVGALLGLGLVGLAYYLVRRHLALRERALAVLHEQRERFRITLTSIGDAVMVTDRHGAVTFLNGVAEALTGWRDDAVGKRLEDVFVVVNEQTRQPIENPVTKVILHGAVVGLANHTVLLTRDGREIPIDDSAAPIRDADGHIVGVVLVFRDITERRRDEKQAAVLHAVTRLLAESDTLVDATPKLLHALCEGLDWDVGNVWLVDSDVQVCRCVGGWHGNEPDRYAEFDAACRQITFVQDSGMIGQVWASGEPACSVDIIHDSHFSRVASAVKAGLRGACAVPIRIDGQVLGVIEFFSTQIRPMDDELLRILTTVGSQVGQFVERHRAEQALRQSEQRSRSVLDHIIDGIMTIDEAGTIDSFNPAAERLFGYSASEVLGQNVKLLMPEPYHSEHDNYLANYLRTGEAKIIGIGREVMGRRKDGSIFPMYLGVSEIRLNGVRLFTGMTRDITERKQLEQELRQKAEQLAIADRRKDEFLATLAHELRNPLAPIRNGVEILRRVGLNEPQFRDVRDMMERQVLQMARLVDDLLEVSRITRGKVRLQKELTELATVVAGAVEISRPLIDQRHHELTISIPHEPIGLAADPTRLAQVLANLLNNAAKYSGERNRIALSAAREDDQAVIRVRDNGIGIAADMLPRIFDMFAQANTSAAHAEGGLGIGLTLVRNLVEMHGGTVQAFSEGLGKGSEFVVRVPLSSGTPISQPGVSMPATQRFPTSARRVLMVDDNRDSVTSLGMILEMEGHDVRTAYDGSSALEIAKVYAPDVVLLDIGLPGSDGYEVARQMRALPALKNVLLVAITGYGQEKDRDRTQEAGFNAHLLKPVELDVLRTLLAHPESAAPRPPTASPD